MTPPRTFRQITTSREMPQNRYLKSINRLRSSKSEVSLRKAPYTTREPQRQRISPQHDLTASTHRHLFKMKAVPKYLKLQVTQIKKIGILQ